MSKGIVRGVLCIAGVGLLSVASGASAAEGAIEEVVVVAQKRTERLQDVPLAVSAFTAEFMEQRNIDEIQDLQMYEPSLRFRETFSTRDSNIEIRGIGSNGQNAGIDSSVGIYLDGVFIPRPTGLIGSLADVEQIEVLKGPQGTLYGVNTPAGLVNVRTRRPTEEFEAQVNAGFGDFNMREVSGYVSGGLTERLAARIAVWTHENDGHTRLVTGGRANGREDWGARAKALWVPDETTEIEFVVDYSKVETNCCVGEWIDISDAAVQGFDRIASRLNLDRTTIFPSRAGDDGFMDRGEKIDHVSFADGDAHEVFEQRGVSVRLQKLLTGRLLDGHELEVVAAYREWDSDQRADVDNQGVDLGILDPQIENQDTGSLEIRLTSPAGRRAAYLAGLYYYYQDSFFQQTTTFQMPLCLVTPFVDAQVASGAIPDTLEARSRCEGAARWDHWRQDAQSIAAFADLSFDVTERLAVSIGGRVTRDDKEGELNNRLFDERSREIVEEFGLACPDCKFGASDATINGFGILFAGVAFEDEVDDVEETWAATIKYSLDDALQGSRAMTYLRVAKGYKAPGINARPIRRDDIPRTFGPETSLLYELGLKSSWFADRLRANLAVYFNEFDDLQQLAANTQRDLGVAGTFVQNAGTLEHYGVELDYVAQPTGWLSLSGAVAYLDSEFEEFDGAPCADPPTYSDVPASPTVEGACDQTGLRAPFTPKWRTNHTARLTFPVAGWGVEWWMQGSVIYTGGHYLDANRDRRSFQDSYTLFDVAAGLAAVDGRWSVRAFVKNVTDEEYLVAVLGGPSLAGFEGLGSDSFIGYLGAPRTFAASLQVNF